jgi:hypothetical protein
MKQHDVLIIPNYPVPEMESTSTIHLYSTYHIVHAIQSSPKKSLTQSKSDFRYRPAVQPTLGNPYVGDAYTPRDCLFRVLLVTARRATALWLELKMSRDDRPY